MFGIRLGKRPPVGTRPGDFVLPDDSHQSRVHVIDYSADSINERDVEKWEELRPFASSKTVTWIDVQGLGDEGLLRAVQEMFDIHPLAMEDVVHVPQRPKVEAYGKTILLISRMLEWEGTELDVQQVSVLICNGNIITFQERHGDVLEPVRRRLREARGLIRKEGTDYLAYAILDTIVDAYFPLLETLGDRMETLEEATMTNPKPEILRDLNRNKRSVLAIRRAVWPTREAVHDLMRIDHDGITESTRMYLRDTYDHCVQTADIVESCREMSSGLMNTYLSVISNRMNEVMKVLTIMASIFIPLTFLAGIYGMNFEVMPETKVTWAYPALLGLMVVVGGGMLLFFRRKGWIGGSS